jgi:hypothetical protein
MSTPTELDVPHWATSMVDNFRRSQTLPSEVTDRMIFARLEECRGMDVADIEDAVGDLRDEVKGA